VGASGGRLSIELGGAGRSHGRASEHSVWAAGQSRWVKEGEERGSATGPWRGGKRGVKRERRGGERSDGAGMRRMLG
jgi:hypothetical protein